VNTMTQHPFAARPSRHQRLAALVAVLGYMPCLSMGAGISTDGSAGAQQTLAGPAFLIPQSLGTVAGQNLFHSFATFGLAAGEAAQFTTTTPTLANVISRVTGGALSQINGAIVLTPLNGGAPNFFLINPAGVTFGAGASVDVPAAFHVSTAHYLKFAGGNFYADTTHGSTFSSESPQAFGFLGSAGSRSAVTVNDGASLGPLKPGAPFQIVAGDVGIDNASIRNKTGDMRVIAMGGVAAEVGLSEAAPAAAGTLTLTNGATLTTVADDASAGGKITVSAGPIVVTGGSMIITRAESSGDAGSVTVRGTELTLHGQGAASATGILSTTVSTGNAGMVQVAVSDQASIVSGGGISSSTFRSGNTGAIMLSAGSLNIDGDGFSAGSCVFNPACLYGVPSARLTGIFGQTYPFSTGNSGSVLVAVADHVAIVNGGYISSSTSGFGNAGLVDVSARSLSIDGQGLMAVGTGIFSSAVPGSNGHAGSIRVTAKDQLQLVNAGEISSNTLGTGNAGEVVVSAGSMALDGQGSLYATGIGSDAGLSTGNAGSIQVTVRDLASIVNGSRISSIAASSGNAGSVTVSAGSLIIDGRTSLFLTGISSNATPGSTGNAGSIQVTTAGQAAILNAGEISSGTFSSGNAGSVRVSVGSLIVDGSSIPFNPFTAPPLPLETLQYYRLNSNSSINASSGPGSSGQTGDVTVTAAKSIMLSDTGKISSDTFGSGNAGSVNVSAGSLLIDGNGLPGGACVFSPACLASGLVGIVTTGIFSQTYPFATGSAGSIVVAVSDLASIVNGGSVSSSTSTSGNAGSVSVSAGNLTIDGQGLMAVGNGIFSSAVPGSTGQAGSIRVTARDQLLLVNAGEISSNTFGPGNAGSVVVSAGRLTLDGQGSSFATGIGSDSSFSSGNAGSVQVTVAELASIVNGSRISSITASAGNAGSVTVSARSLNIDARDSPFLTGISSNAVPGSTGNAGSIQVTVAEEAAVLNAGEISSGTFAGGKAGAVRVSAGSLTVAGSVARVDTSAGPLPVETQQYFRIGSSSTINASASPGSSGQTGDVVVFASNDIALRAGGTISIKNDATVLAPTQLVPTRLAVSAPTITLIDSSISAASSGNVAASDIRIDFDRLLYLDPSFITTSANAGNGGSIVIVGNGILFLDQSQISTSVASLTNGNGGDITISTPFLVLNTGFVQANTAAAQAIGGNVTINANAIFASGATLLLGGSTPLTFDPDAINFNVIQAAAPTGLSGNISVTAPVLDVSGSLAALSANVLADVAVGRSLCSSTGGSSLAQAGRGGMPVSSRDLLTVDSAVADAATATTGGLDPAYAHLALARCP
jgi:filamentous hemagglutinin family protein